MKRLLIGIFLITLVLAADEREKLKQIQEQITEIKNRLDAIKQEKSSILNEIYRIELEYEAAIIESRRLQMGIDNTEAKIGRQDKQRAVLEERIGQSREGLRRMVRILHKMGDMGYLRILASIRSFDQLFRNYRLLVAIMDIQKQQIVTVKRDIAQLQLVRAELEKEHARLAQLKSAHSEKIAQYQRKKNEKMEFIRQINRQRDSNMQLMDELNAEATRLTELLSGASAEFGESTSFSLAQKGALPWPLSGEVISTFGKKKSPRFDTYTINNGIEIRPTASEEIRAVAAGQVVFADYFRGYGNLLILQHNRDFHSLYGHCATLLKKKSEAVKAGETIARVGSSGSTAGKSLYFEIRAKLKPEDPLDWLKKK